MWRRPREPAVELGVLLDHVACCRLNVRLAAVGQVGQRRSRQRVHRYVQPLRERVEPALRSSVISKERRMSRKVGVVLSSSTSQPVILAKGSPALCSKREGKTLD